MTMKQNKKHFFRVPCKYAFKVTNGKVLIYKSSKDNMIICIILLVKVLQFIYLLFSFF